MGYNPNVENVEYYKIFASRQFITCKTVRDDLGVFLDTNELFETTRAKLRKM